MKLNFFGREIILKKEVVVVGAAILLLLGCLVGYIFLRDDNDIIIEAGGNMVTAVSTGAAISPDGDVSAAASGGRPEAAATGVPQGDSAVQADRTICVYVVGCVKQPGIVTIRKGQLINDAVKAAGGLTQDADAENINLVYSLNENVMLNIKSKVEAEQAPADPSGSAKANMPSAAGTKAGSTKQVSTGTTAVAVEGSTPGLGSGAELVSESGNGAIISGESTVESGPSKAGNDKNLVNINTAGADELDTLPGVGEATARDIIAFREKNGRFGRIEDIMKVPRIKQSRFDSIKDFITVE